MNTLLFYIIITEHSLFIGKNNDFNIAIMVYVCLCVGICV